MVLLFLEQGVEPAARVVLPGCCLRSCRTVYECEVVTEIAAPLVDDTLGLRLAAIVVGPWAVEAAIQADVQVGPAGWAHLLASDFSLHGNFFPAGMADFHTDTLPTVAIRHVTNFHQSNTLCFCRASWSRFAIPLRNLAKAEPTLCIFLLRQL